MSHTLRVVPDSMLNVRWEKDWRGHWYPFQVHHLDSVFGSGVAAVWCDGDPISTLFIGHGDLPHVLHQFHENRAVGQYRKLAVLRFTWGEVPLQLQRGVARYLTEQLRPVFEDNAAMVPRIAVNLPL